MNIEHTIHQMYAGTIRDHLSLINQQRLKLLWFGWGYYPMLALPRLSIWQRLSLLFKFLKVDWYVPHGHTPYECALVCQAIASHPACPGGKFVEAGCWQGGSSAKWSIICALFGYQVIVYDSFEGVEPGASPKGEYDYSGEYAAQEALVDYHVAKYGVYHSFKTVKGWFSNTMQRWEIKGPVVCAYIDCDTAKGTQEALQGIIPAMTDPSAVFSQDYHIPSVIRLFTRPEVWKESFPWQPMLKRQRLGYRLVRLTLPEKA